MISKNFIKGSLIYTLTGALPMASALLLLPFYIAYLPAEVYGALSVYLAFSVLIQIVTTYSFDTSLYIHYHELEADFPRLSVFISSSFVFIMLLGALITLFLMVAGDILFSLFPTQQISFYPYGLIAALIGVLQALFKVHSNLLQTREKPATYIWLNLLLFSLITISTLTGLKLYPGTLIGPLGGRLLSALIMVTWILYRLFNEFGFHLKNPWKIVPFGFNFYTFIYQIQQWVINYLDRFILLLYLPLASLGVYNFAINCLVVIELCLNGLHASIFPRIIKRLNAQPERKSSVEINRYYYGLIAVVMLLICFSIFVIPVVIDLFVKKSSYPDSVQYLPYLALIYIFRAMRLYFAVPFNVYKYIQQLQTINFIAALVKIVLMIMLIKVYGIFGVIMSAYLSSLTEILLLWYFLRKKYEMNFNTLKLIWLPLSLLILVLFIEPVIPSDFSTVVHFGYGFFCVAVLLIAYRNEWKLLSTLKF